MTHHNSDEYSRERYEGPTPTWSGTFTSPPPAPVKKKRSKKKIVGWSIGGVVVLITVISISSGNTAAAPTSPTAPSLTVTPSIPDTTAYAPTTTEAPAPPAPVGPVTTFTDGTYQVGVDIAPGRYKTAGADPSLFADNCYTERESDDSGEFSSIIANNNTTGPYSVTVKKGEFFKADGCLPFTKVG
jgi:hypothetical protein